MQTPPALPTPQLDSVGGDLERVQAEGCSTRHSFARFASGVRVCALFLTTLLSASEGCVHRERRRIARLLRLLNSRSRVADELKRKVTAMEKVEGWTGGVVAY